MPVLTKINTNVIADNAITAAKTATSAEEESGGLGLSTASTGNLTGTISTQQLQLADAFTLTGDLTVNDDLILGKVRDDGTGQSITGSGKTLTGTGTLTMGSYLEGEPKAGRVTSVVGMTGDLGSGVTIGSDVTGFTGIKEIGVWNVTTPWTGSASTAIVNWEKADFGDPTAIGSGMTQSSGIFTFPSTGHWLVEAWVNFRTSSAISSGYNNIVIKYSSNSGSSWADIAMNYVGVASVSDWNASPRVRWILDVTNTSTQKIKFTTSTANNSVTQFGNTNCGNTGAMFMRLGDT